MTNAPKPRGPGRRLPKKIITTKSGKTIRVNQSIIEKRRASKEARQSAKAAYLSTLPKNRFKRILYRMHPKRLAAYWFSREGGIMALKLTGVGVVVMFLLVIGIFAYFRKDLPKIKDLSGEKTQGSITYYDKTGTTVLWQDYDAVKRQPVSGDKISKFLKDATVAIEDKDFYNHGAFDTKGIMRAAVNNVFGSGGTQGGSTITQQLVKVSQEWTNDRTITRKVKELILAVDLERQYSKDEILVGYLNLAPYGPIHNGAESASRDYFGKGAKDLTLAEASLLAAIPKSPSLYSSYGPYFDPEATKNRQEYILDQMVEQGYVKKTEADAAKKVDVLATVQPLKPKYSGIQAPYFVLAAKQELERKYSKETVQRGGWEVKTTLDLNLQKIAEEKVQKGLPAILARGGDSAAFAATEVETGQVVSLVGGADFNNTEYGQFNFGTSLLPPGSSFKPYDYAALIENSENAGAGSVLYDTQGALPGYACTNKQRPKNGGNCLWNYDFGYPGPVTLRYALGGSRNVPAVKAMVITGVDKTIQTANKLMTGDPKKGYGCYAVDDISNATDADKSECFASSAIGDGAYLRLDDHINGYASLSRYGEYLPKTYILEIKDASGKVIDKWQKAKGKQAVRPDTAFIVSDIMSDPNASYLRTKLHRFNGGDGTWNFAVKTGTTNDNKDGWMMGFSTKYAAGVWVGYHTRQVEMRQFMEDMTQPIFNGWMQDAHRGVKAANWVKPSSVKTAPAYVIRNKVSRNSEIIPSPSSDLYPSWYVSQAGNNTSQTIDKVSNKVATSCTPQLARQSQSNANDNKFSVDTFVGGGNRSSTTTATDDIHNCNDTKPSVSLTAPPTCSSAASCTFTVTVQQGTHALSSDKFAGTINLLNNGQVVKATPVPTSASGVYTTTIEYYPGAGAGNLSVQYIDSVLYDATSEASAVTFTSAPSTPPESGDGGGPGSGD